MKKIILLMLISIFASLVFAQEIDFNPEAARKNYGNKITVTPKDGSVKITSETIILSPKKEGSEYTISGYFKGTIVNKTKNTVIKLKDVFIENTNGEAAIYGEAKTEISTVKGSENYLLSSGTSSEKTAALQCKKNLELGGSGKLYVLGSTYHAIKGNEVKLKGSGNLFLQGTEKGSCINCKTLVSGKDKTFSCYLLNTKNGVKADDSINLESGNFFAYGIGTVFKTDTKEDDGKDDHYIKVGDAVKITQDKN